MNFSEELHDRTGKPRLSCLSMITDSCRTNSQPTLVAGSCSVPCWIPLGGSRTTLQGAPLRPAFASPGRLLPQHAKLGRRILTGFPAWPRGFVPREHGPAFGRLRIPVNIPSLASAGPRNPGAMQTSPGGRRVWDVSDHERTAQGKQGRMSPAGTCSRACSGD
jgi:hypothetical protein